jgi:hypothetical protein
LLKNKEEGGYSPFRHERKSIVKILFGGDESSYDERNRVSASGVAL